MRQHAQRIVCSAARVQVLLILFEQDGDGLAGTSPPERLDRFKMPIAARGKRAQGLNDVVPACFSCIAYQRRNIS
jgi:hypothetical protein